MIEVLSHVTSFIRIGLLAAVLLVAASPPRLEAGPSQLGYGLGSGNHPSNDAPVEQVSYHQVQHYLSNAPARAHEPAPTSPLQVTSTFFVTTTADTGSGSLRAAITAANANPGLDQISFLIVPGGPQTIAPLSRLPDITGPVIIDGTTQPGYSGTPIIELTGTSAGPNAIGLVLQGGNSIVRGLVINRWATTGSGGFGIVLDAGSNNVIEGNYIGTDLSGIFPRPNAVNGIAIFGTSAGNRIGGTTAAARNVISGNTSSGIQVVTGSTGRNLILGNYIGLNAFGTSALPNGGNGIFVNAPDDTIGGTRPGARNVISGNALPGIFIGVSAPRTVVLGNYIGTDATGHFDVGNAQNGVNIDRSPDNVIGDSSGVGRNVISGNEFPAVYIIGAAATGNRVQGNFLCVDQSGSGALGDGNGVVIDAASGNRVGGVTLAARNVIAGTPNTGIALINGASGNRILGNYIGTDSSGVAPVPTLKGVLLSASPANIVGGTGPGEGNVISGNTTFGVELRNATMNNVLGNRIGTDRNGTANVGNGSHGVVFTVGASVDSIIGNTIAFNRGVGVYDSSGTNNVFRRNSIFENQGRGIDLFPLGLTPNDSLDSDAGANDLQNFPVLDSASVSGGETRVYGRLDATPNRTYVLEFFSNDLSDPSHFGEGQTYIGSKIATTDPAGRAFLGVTLPALTLNKFITATATDSLSGTTSEFSQALCLNDTDGDGLWDCWETEGWGIDVNSDGVIDLDLFARGARPGHKDLFVEIDAMVGHAPPPAALQMVKDAFARVPNTYLGNPDVNPGIALHYTLDETNVPSRDLPNMWQDFADVKDVHFGTVAERSDPNRRFILQAKRLAYRYGLWGRTFSTGFDTLASGVGELTDGAGGDDFLVAFGAQGVCGWRDTVDASLHAGTFMHELGHTLGLRHGGIDDKQMKPNYYSVMNYAWTTPEPRWQAPGSWRLDYSPVQLPTLDERHLNERNGLGVPAGVWPIVTVPYLDSNFGLRQARLEPGAAVDWSGDSTISSVSNVIADINSIGFGLVHCDGAVEANTSPGEILPGHADWSNLRYNFRNSPAWLNVLSGTPPEAIAEAARVGLASSQGEMTPALLAHLAKMPAPRPKGRFVMDGALDPSAQLLASNAGIDLYADYQAGQLYVATESAASQGADMVVFLADVAGALRSAPLGKAGRVGAWKALLSNRTSGNATDWANGDEVVFSSISVDSSGGFAEGVVDVGLLFGGNPPDLLLAVGKYAAAPGGALLAQVPAGNGDGDIDGSEYQHLAMPTGVPPASPSVAPRLQLAPIQPNPAVGSVRTSLTLREAADVEAVIQDVSGRKVATLARGAMGPGRHDLFWNPTSGSGLRQAPGVYFLVVRAFGEVQASRLVLLK